jgi:hypothetical protein
MIRSCQEGSSCSLTPIPAMSESGCTRTHRVGLEQFDILEVDHKNICAMICRSCDLHQEAIEIHKRY